MLTRALWKSLLSIVTKKITNTSTNIPAEKMRKQEYKIKVHKIHDLTYFMQVINRDHSLSQTNRMLHALATGGGSINKKNFESIFKKYCYYIEIVAKKQQFLQSPLQERLNFLQSVTQIYQRYGRLASAHMIKTFNKVSDEVFRQTKQQLFSNTPEITLQDPLYALLSILVGISRYNKNKSIALYKQIEHRLSSQKMLIKISKQSGLLYMQLMSNTNMYNRLIIETTIDVLQDQIQYLNYEEGYKVIYCLASSNYPLNRKFMGKLIDKVNKEFGKKVDATSGQSVAKNSHELKRDIKILASISMLEVNMNLASAYLPELNRLYEIQLYEIGIKHISKIADKDLQKYCGFLRRTSFCDKNLLQALIIQVLRREVKQLKEIEQEKIGISNDEDSAQRDNRDCDQISLNTICAAIHVLASFNYRSRPFISYFLKLLELLSNASNVKQSNYKQNTKEITISQFDSNRQGKRISLDGLIHFKYYPRVIWSLCVLGTKEELAKVYTIFEKFFCGQYAQSKEIQQVYNMLNFYYCYLLLKAYFPKSNLSFQKLVETLENKHLISNISLTHLQVYKTFIQAGIPVLKQHNISNIMCDIFIPRYISRDGKYQVNNVIIDIHGPHHFMRNCEELKGNSILKKKILENQGYIYQYIGISEWELVTERKDFLITLMENIVEKFGETSSFLKIDHKKHMN